jgi:hypothetical protein
MAAKYKHVKSLSALEVEEKMEMGLCFLCDEPFTLEHHELKHKRIRFKVMEMDEEVDWDVSHKPSNLNCNLISTQSYEPELGYSSMSEGGELLLEKDEEVQGIVEDSQKSSICTQKTPSPTTNYNIAWDSKSSTSKIDVVSVDSIMSPINYAVTKRLKLTLLNQQANVAAFVPVMVRQLKVLLSFENLK